MASEIGVLFGPGTRDAERAFADVSAVFRQVESECTRFDPASELMRANAAAARWCSVGPYCYAALVEAQQAYEATRGLFDPRVLRTLRRLGYGESLPFASGDVTVAAAGDEGTAGEAGRWTPEFDADAHAVRIGPDPVDLGGIGKGLAVRWAAEQIRARVPSFVIDAGGDCYLRGNGPDATGWHVGVEDPRGGSEPIAVLTLSDAACATSSIRLRRWTTGGKPVHHLIDPRSGHPGGAGLLAVTVVGPDPADAEVMSKVLFLHGSDGISSAADGFGAAALWVLEDGSLGMTEALRLNLIWQAS